MNEFVRDETRVVVHPQEFLNMMDAFTGDKRYREIAKYIGQKEKKEATKMCMLLDMLEEQGMEKGQERTNKLTICLAEDGRSEEILRAAKDKEFQEKLMREYGL